MILNDILKTVESKYPLSLQYNWDNSGLNIGDEDQEVKKIMLTLDVTEKTVDEAIEKNVDLIISHHPFLFSKINKVNKKDIKGKLIYKLISNSISVYCMHTSYDLAFDGLNDYFMKLIDAKTEEILDVEGRLDSYLEGRNYGLGRTGKLNQAMKIEDLINHLKEKLKIQHLRYVGQDNIEISTIAVVTGAGAEFFQKAKDIGIDLLVTGDMKYHQAMDAMEINMPVVDCGHYGSEHIFADSLIDFLESNLSEVDVIKSENIVNPFKEI